MELKLTPAAEKFISRMVRFSGAGDQAGFRLSVSARSEEHTSELQSL